MARSRKQTSTPTTPPNNSNVSPQPGVACRKSPPLEFRLPSIRCWRSAQIEPARACPQSLSQAALNSNSHLLDPLAHDRFKRFLAGRQLSTCADSDQAALLRQPFDHGTRVVNL